MIAGPGQHGTMRRLGAVAVASIAMGAAATVAALPAAGAAASLRAPGAPGLRQVSADQVKVTIRAPHAGRRARFHIRVGSRIARTARVGSTVVVVPCGRWARIRIRQVDVSTRAMSAWSAVSRTHMPTCVDHSNPSVPSHLRAVRVGSDRVFISWGASSDRGRGVGGYRITRNGAMLGQPRDTSFLARNLQPNTEYTFRVSARDRAGNEGPTASLVVTTAPPVQTSGKLRAYVLTSAGDSIRSMRESYQRLSVVYPTFYRVALDGSLSGRSDQAIVRFAQERGVRVLPRIYSSNSTFLERLFTDPVLRDAFVESAASAAAIGGFDGLNLDFEPSPPMTALGGMTAADRRTRMRVGLNDLVNLLAARLHAQGQELSIAIAANWCATTNQFTRAPVYCTDSGHASATGRPRPALYDPVGLAQAADEVWLLTWGLHWATSEPGAVAPVDWLRGVTGYYRDRFAKAGHPELLSRFTLGTNLYAFDWSYRVARRDQVTMPLPAGTALPAAPTCRPGDATATARLMPSFAGNPATGGTLTMDWACIDVPSTALQRGDIDRRAASLGATPVMDPASGEMHFTYTDSSGTSHSVWYPGEGTLDLRRQIANEAGMQLGLWRLGDFNLNAWADPGSEVAP